MMARLICMVVLSLYLCWGLASADAQEKPNIVLVLADDWGYGSAGCYGADSQLIKTPAVDRLAREGIRFTDANTPSSVCSPTRYGLLMGRYPWRTRLKRGVVNMADPLLPDPRRPSLGKWLQSQGYRTAAIGKWHLGYGGERKASTKDWTQPNGLKPGALEMGFDYHFAVPQNHGDPTGIYIENDHIFGLESDRVYPYSRSFYGKPYYGFDAPQRDNKQVMRDLTDRAVAWLQQRSDKPFFLYFAPVAVHHPITPSDAMRGESGCGPYGDFIQDLDLSIGRLCEAVEGLGATDNTLIIVTADNGGDIPKGERPETIAQSLGLQINGKLRGDKHTIWQGGCQVPFIVRWPAKLPAGRTSAATINLVDVFPTIVDLLADEPPKPTELSPDGVSFRRALLGEESQPRPAMITTDALGRFAIRRGDWKYIEGDASPRGVAPALYNLSQDPAESRNRLVSERERVQSLQAELDRLRGDDVE